MATQRMETARRANPQPRATRGIITAFDPGTGIASVTLQKPKGTQAELHMGAFFSGRSARPPSTGDKVTLSVKDSPEGVVVLVARLIDEARRP
jgi:hypothetical protein